MDKLPKTRYTFNYVPATPNTYATIISCDAPEDRLPTMEDIEVWRTPIVAWEIETMFTDDDTRPSYSIAWPVLVDFKDDESVYLIEGPGTQLTSPEEKIFSDIEDAKKGVLETKQMYWEAAQLARMRKEKKANG